MAMEIKNAQLKTAQKQQAVPKVKTDTVKDNSVFQTSRQEQANAMMEDALGELLDELGQ